MAAIHEAGHVTIARHLGLTAVSAWIEETPDPGEYDKLWIGHMQYLPPSISKTNASRSKLAMFGVAGAVAESCWKRETFDDTHWEDPAVMSESDWAACGCEPGDPSPRLLNIIESVYSLFDREIGKLWLDVLKAARLLIENSRDPKEMARN